MSKKRILIVEDEKMLLELYSSVFLRQGSAEQYEVFKAQNFEEAQQALASGPFAFVLSDYHLPGNDGISLIRLIKQQTPQTIVVLISGYLTPAIIQTALAEGAYTCLKKPCSIATLLETAEQAMKEEAAPEQPISVRKGQVDKTSKETTESPSMPSNKTEKDSTAQVGTNLKALVKERPELQIISSYNSKKQAHTPKDFFLIALDQAARIIYCDDNFSRVLNIPKDKIISHSITDFLFSYFQQLLQKENLDFLSFARQNLNRQLTIDFICGEDKIRRPLLCEFFVLPEDSNSSWQLLICGMDIGKRLELSRLIEFERESLKQLRAGQFDLVITVNQELMIKTVNTRCLERLKARPRELINNSFLDLLAKPSDRQTFEQAVQQARILDHVFNLRSNIFFKGQTIPVLMNINTVRDSYNNEVGYVFVIHDISRQLKLEATLRSVERMQALGQLAAGTAHQINNYTNTILGSAEMLRNILLEAQASQSSLPPDSLNFLNIILESTNKLTALTHHLTNFARAQQTPVISAGDVNSVIRDVLTLVSTQLKKKSITLNTLLAANLPKIFFSPLHLEQAILNIVMNAIDAVSEKKGILTITTEADAEWVYIRIKDNGPGIPEEIRDQLFEAFVTTKPPGVGTGLGLNIARDVIESIKGTIEVDSSPERGTTMTIRIPIIASNNGRDT